MMTKPPCKECGSRYLGCHANCTKYIEFRRKRANEIDSLSLLMKTIPVAPGIVNIL